MIRKRYIIVFERDDVLDDYYDLPIEQLKMAHMNTRELTVPYFSDNKGFIIFIENGQYKILFNFNYHISREDNFLDVTYGYSKIEPIGTLKEKILELFV